ncbi:G-type lectin S-receptor-like serine/threonine-protein kinase At1g67520 isoform X2 [Argentina anserina]|uniref:G-type lectin S-receptor-like serine/threonine-protein kinase At1g67520 isoform X2 n=1 Tax=Argentina anserina TaxID=57926 RepID=UPI0021763764|nr:G-type lectin S-receptor-like serine/threonine-protein kinase At1g67520 isoform X2 [Potentilla anserina]
MINLLCLLISSSILSACHGAVLSIGDTLKPGEALNSSSFLVSSSGEYTLGFNSSYLTLRSKEYTIWVANPYDPISDPSSALFTLDKTRTLLQVTQKGGKPIVLHTSPDNVTNVEATLSDSGILILQDVDLEVSDSPKQQGPSTKVLWQSFDHPTVALMPEMKLGVDRVGNNWSLSSWREGQTIPGLGSFTLDWEFNTRQLQVRRSGEVCWTSGQIRSGTFPYIDIPKESKVSYNFTMVSNGNEDYFSYTAVGDQTVGSVWVLDTGGQLHDVTHNISIVRAGDCDGYNTSAGCKRWGARTTDCVLESGNDFELIKNGFFKPINGDTSINSTWLDSNQSRLGSDHCKATCWKDCDCLGFDFLFDNQTCRYWSVEYSQFLVDPASSTTSYILRGAMKIKPFQRNGLNKLIWIGLAIAGVLLALVLFSMCYLIRKRKLAAENQTKIQDMLNIMKSNRPTDANGLQNDGKGGQDLSVFSYASIIAATCNFSNENKLGEGGFGPVYKGKLVTGQEVAVKRLSKRSGQGISEFRNELILIYELQHTNLVQLFGFCIHGEERMLIYEYMQNKSLDYFLFDSTRCQQLDWNRRFNIIEGIAQGLLYLHKYSRTRIIHRDLKASNVLLDERMNPKISDFGMARIFANDEQEAKTMKIVGTRGYMSPEYVMGGNFSIKSDVYSFGVLMLEILSGRKNNSFYNDDRAINLVGYAWALWKEGAGLGLMDPTLGDSCDKDKFLRCIHVGLLCVEENAAHRPMMLDSISMMTNESMSLPVPTKPAFCTERNVITAAVGGNGPEMVASVNCISYSDFDGR